MWLSERPKAHHGHMTQTSRYLVLNGGDVAFIPPVQGTWGLQEVGLHEQGPCDLPLCFVLVAIHDLPELLVGLERQNPVGK